MVGVAQLVEPRVVISAVVGSSPIVHPIFRALKGVVLALVGVVFAVGAVPSGSVRGNQIERDTGPSKQTVCRPPAKPATP